MSSPKIISEEPMLLAEVKEVLKKNKEELNYRAGKTEDYLNQIPILNSKKAKELYKSIEGLDIPRFKEVHITKIVDLLPTTQEEVKVALQGYTITVSADNCKKIAEIVKANQ